MGQKKMAISYLFPQGRKKALTFSYDDGNDCDRRLAEIFTRHGMKATFNLNSAFQNNPGKIHLDELKSVFLDHGHEVACHGARHPFEEQITLTSLLEDVRSDRIALEKAAGCPVNGMAYPFGTYTEEVKSVLRALGIVYARTVQSLRRTNYIPEDWLEWHPTAHHRENILELGKAFLNNPWGLHLLYIWGHAFEFDRNNNWEIIEEFCDFMAHNDAIWYATNMEIHDYVEACRSLIPAMDNHFVRNPSVLSVWIDTPEGVREIPPGETLFLS